MTSTPLKTTTAILTALSLMQPTPGLTQSRPGVNADEAGLGRGKSSRNDRANKTRSIEEICAEAGISDTPACELHVQSLQAEAAAAKQANEETEAAQRASAEAEAANRAKAEADADAISQARADAAQQAEAVVKAAGAESEKPRATQIVEDCPAEVASSDGIIRCVDALTGSSVAAIASESNGQAAPEAEVTTETITDGARRSSREEFRDRDRDERTDSNGGLQATAKSDKGLSDLEKAGLFALGAVVVGAILANGQRVASNTGDRIIVVDDEGDYQVLKDDDALLRQSGSEVRTERFNDGSTRITAFKDDGSRIVTIRDSSGRALRRVRIDPDGREYLLIDDTRDFEPVIVRDLPRPGYDDFDYRAATDRESLRQALLAADRRNIGRSFSLRQVRQYNEVRELAPEININAITFATNSAALQPSEAKELRQLGLLMRELVANDPTELFLVEGHTDAVGDEGYNLLLSDRRAESVALALNEYFEVPAENLVVQGYGERFVKIPTQQAERLNRRVAIRRITGLMR